MQVSIFTDEINRKDPERAIDLAAQWGVSFVEVRSLVGGRFPRVSDAELEVFYARIQDAGLEVSAVSPGFFKGSVDDPAVLDGIENGLPRACEWAKRWGTDLVSCFGFERAEEGHVPGAVMGRLDEMAEIAARAGCRLVLENEAVCWGATGVEAAQMVREIGVDRMGLCWDPGNSARAGSAVPFPDEYEALKDLVTHMHVKNFNAVSGKWALAEEGVVDWPGQFRALKEDGYEGFVVVETHLDIHPDIFEVAETEFGALEANSLRNLKFVRSQLAR